MAYWAISLGMSVRLVQVVELTGFAKTDMLPFLCKSHIPFLQQSNVLVTFTARVPGRLELSLAFLAMMPEVNQS